MQIGLIIQGRMTSERLPGKVLRPIHGKPLLGYMVDGLSRCRWIESLVVATSNDPTDDAVAEFCAEKGVTCFRGSLHDVAGRFAGVLSKVEWGGFVRVSGDSPLIDHRLVDRLVSQAKTCRYDIVTNVHPRSFPVGQSIEVVRTDSFLQAYRCMHSSHEREHVTKYFYLNEDKYEIVNVQREFDCSDIRMAVDTPDDLSNFETVLSNLCYPHWQYAVDDLIDVYRQVSPNSHRKAA